MPDDVVALAASAKGNACLLKYSASGELVSITLTDDDNFEPHREADKISIVIPRESLKNPIILDGVAHFVDTEKECAELIAAQDAGLAKSVSAKHLDIETRIAEIAKEEALRVAQSEGVLVSPKLG